MRCGWAIICSGERSEIGREGRLGMTETGAGRGRQSLVLGIVLITVAFLCVAVMSAFGKAASAVPTAAIAFFQSFISLLVFLPWVLRKGTQDLRTKKLSLHIARALAGLLSQVLYFWAVRELSLVDAVLLVNAAPLFIPLVAYFWDRTPVTPAVIGSLLVGFVGVIMIIKPSPALLENPSAVIALSAALFSAIALCSVHKLSGTDGPDTILFYYFLIASLATAPFAFFTWQPLTGMEWGWLLGVGVTMAAAQLLIILAYEHASASQIAPFNYSVVIFSGLIGWMVWGNTLGLLALAGIVLVCAGGILSILLSPVARPSLGTMPNHGHGMEPKPPEPAQT
ncbi:DMT family transporter [soil metagenome]